MRRLLMVFFGRVWRKLRARLATVRGEELKKFPNPERTVRQVALASLLLSLTMPAMAESAAGNLPPDFYPQPTCEKPQSPGKSPGVGDQNAMLAYNAKVRNFNKQAEAFNACMKDYSDKAQNDINAILATVRAAVAAANQP
jgi:hypothetical protein